MNNQRAWIIGGSTLFGLGIGFVFLQQSVLYFVASILIGTGVGLLIASIIPTEKE